MDTMGLCPTCGKAPHVFPVKGERAIEALKTIQSELGVPTPNYPANVANAYKIALEAIDAYQDT